MTQEQLEALCAEWQRRLRLQDWDVKIRLRRRYDMWVETNQGECKHETLKKLALVNILDPTDYDPDNVWPQDVERTVVHELLHLHFAPFVGDYEQCNAAHEQAIDLIAGALVDAKRFACRTCIVDAGFIDADPLGADDGLRPVACEQRPPA